MAFAANHCAFVIWHTLLTFTLIRFGVLATVAALYTAFIIEEFPLTTNWSAWYAPADLLGIATLIALALYGFVTTLWGWGLWAAKLDTSWNRQRWPTILTQLRACCSIGAPGTQMPRPG